MNEEEKKAVGLLKALNNLEKKCKIEKVPYKSEIKKIRISLLPEDYGIFEILINLIEKLQKENKEWQEAYKSEKKMKNEYVKLYQDLLLKENVIPIQKVKDKISERQFELQQEYKDFEDDAILTVLQELLEGRK